MRSYVVSPAVLIAPPPLCPGAYPSTDSRRFAEALRSRIREAVRTGIESNPLLLLQLHVQPQPADLVREHVEAGRRPGLERVLALDHGLVDLRPPLDVVALDRQQLLEDVGGPVGLQRPHFHLPEP